MTTTNTRFVTKNGLDNNSNSITNLGATGASLALSGANALTFTTTGTTNITLPTSGTIVTTTVGNIAGSASTVTTAAQPNITSVGTLTALTVTGTITTGGVEVGFRDIPQNSQSAAYTLVLTDSGKHILHPSADTTARTFTIPANSSVAYAIGTAITFINQHAGGAITIAITTDTMRLAGAGTTGSRTLAANGVATAVKVTSTEWIISGTNLT